MDMFIPIKITTTNGTQPTTAKRDPATKLLKHRA